MDFGYGWGMGWFGHAIGAVLHLLVGFFVFLVIVGFLFLLVRFLLHATTAAKIYVAKNSPARPVAPAAASTVPSTTVAKPTTKPAPDAGPKPPTKPRAPKAPPA